MPGASELYEETGGNSWKNRSKWLWDPSPCNWHGVTCGGGCAEATNPLGVCLYGLDSHDNGLTGPIPEGLRHLRPILFRILS